MSTEKYYAVCKDADCFRMVSEEDIERDEKGIICIRSKICHNCRTPQDKRAIKNFRRKRRESAPTTGSNS